MLKLDIREMQEPMSLKQAIQGMIPEAMEILHGKVISADPLQIQVSNDEKLVLTKNIICLPRHLSNYKTTAAIYFDDSNETAVNASMTVHNELKEGETVYILSFNHRKKYYILDRGA